MLGLGQSFREEGKQAQQRSKKRIDVKKVARLSKLALSPEEEKAMEGELSAIIAFADQLAAIDTVGVPPAAHILPMQNVLRKDEVLPSMPREQLLENAPSAQDGYLMVPQVIE